jgi:glutathione S-transferase
MARVLYHFKMSVFSRRARLALAHKGLDCDLRDGRSNPAFFDEAKKLFPLATMPVFVDGDAVIGDSTAITHYLDRAYPDKPIWPTSGADYARAIRVTTLVDGVLNTMVDLGTRYYALRNDPAWADVTRERLGRADKALALIEDAIAGKTYTTIDSWSASDIWIASMVLWIDGLPARASTSPLVAQVLSLGLRLPKGLVTWFEKHEERADIAGLEMPASLRPPPLAK